MQTESLFSAENSSDHAEKNSAAARIRAEIRDWWQSRGTAKTVEVRPLRKLLTKNCLFWGMPTRDVIHQPVIARLLQLKPKLSKDDAHYDYTEAAKLWIQQTQEECEADTVVATLLEGLAWAHALPNLTERCDEKAWIELLETLLGLTDHEEEAREIGRFIVQVEMPLTLAHAVPDLSCCKSLRKPARARFSDFLEEMLDGEGTPHAKDVGDIHYLLASCTRSLAIDADGKKAKIDRAGRSQFRWLTRQTLRWSRPNGSGILQEAVDSPHFEELMKYALEYSGDAKDRAAHQLLRGKRRSGTDLVKTPEPSVHSEWSESATMRTTWDPKAPRLAVHYPDRTMDIELGVGKETILSGRSEPRIVVDGELLDQESEWSDVCWESDEDLDYLELECTLSGGWTIQRQLLLARKDQFVLIADAITGLQSAEIQYQHTLPLVDGMVVEQSDENTEAMILGEKKLGHILPLALSEWKSAPSNDRFRVEPLRLEMSARASAIYCPLFISLNPMHRNKSLTWRQLTVAEEMLIVSPEVAVAYRIQIGKAQWVIYRSLSTPGNRTFLGQNLISDFFVARFHQNGETQMLLDVEPS